MAGYTHIWTCESCGESVETMDRPKVNLCGRCDDVSKVRCAACGCPTAITPKALRRARKDTAVHGDCVLMDMSASAEVEA
jgi:predicted RNA-binding Zn-ribbon protein involved in translation (DUF1610 family)